MKIQTQFRGKQGRMAFKQKQMDVAEKKAQERIKREKQEQEEMEGAATLIQGKWRGKMSKDELERRRQAKRARELLEEKDLHEREMAALKIQGQYRVAAAKKKAAEKKQSAHMQAMKAAAEEERRAQRYKRCELKPSSNALKPKGSLWSNVEDTKKRWQRSKMKRNARH